MLKQNERGYAALQFVTFSVSQSNAIPYRKCPERRNDSSPYTFEFYESDFGSGQNRHRLSQAKLNNLVAGLKLTEEKTESASRIKPFNFLGLNAKET